MELFDIFDEICSKSVIKTDTGDNRIFGAAIGVVAKNYDREMPGRVCVRIPTRDENANELQWARVVMPFGGKNRGQYFLPETGDQVLLCFEQGNIEKPFVIGCVPRERDAILTGSAHESNRYKKIVTRNGSAIQFEDGEADDGSQDRIAIMTAKKTLRFELENTNRRIVLGDKESKNEIELWAEQGKTKLCAENRLMIRVGDNIEIIMSAATGTVSVKCNKLRIESGNEIRVKSDGRCSLSGSDVSISAASSLKAESSGMAGFGGATTRIGK